MDYLDALKLKNDALIVDFFECLDVKQVRETYEIPDCLTDEQIEERVKANKKMNVNN